MLKMEIRLFKFSVKIVCLNQERSDGFGNAKDSVTFEWIESDRES